MVVGRRGSPARTTPTEGEVDSGRDPESEDGRKGPMTFALRDVAS